MLTRLFSLPAVALLWLLHFLPLSLLTPLGRALGALLYRVGGQRRKIAETNLALCFPELSAVDRNNLAKMHFAQLGRSMLERSIFWWGSRERIERTVRVVGEEKIRAELAAGKPVILMAPHFLGLDAGGVAITMRFNIVSIYSEQTNPVFNQVLLKGRSRFGDQLLLSRQDGARATVKAMKSGRPFYYLPDLNPRRRDAVFVPFFGIQTATITGLPRLARAAGATVLSCVTRMLPGSAGYEVHIGDAWTDFPGTDPVADAARMNAWIEAEIRTMPSQYYWVHRRFKTRPPGEPRPY
ncbi:lipid A biosynthesis acyltransferase [Azonexus hydrophilus]|uniref:Lipid A biosynthesis acyltransferase n=1 Tax=Azonexus hydrophilus TaxID=418702 RepID=A0A1R1I4G6_9RHOO|nr:lysophospholipid acyltransferase family protein [Azonexus hydrophilus]OMG53605.1 lipid A biosynthesis acyltransferase [Azonexus hydrophilus]